MQNIIAKPLTKTEFALFGHVIEKHDSDSFLINNGKCRRHHALARADIEGEGGAVGISIFSGQPYSLPHTLDMVERHPLGSQAFYPLGNRDWLVIVCNDKNGEPDIPQAFLASENQGINLNRNVWHGVLTPLEVASDFLVVDRIGEGNNLVEHHFTTPYTIAIDPS